MTTFKNPHDPENIIITAKIHEWVRTKMKLPEDTMLQVLEVDCADSGCLDKETRILITSANSTRQLRIHKPLVYVRAHDVDHLVENI
ncbi:MAG TPA: hypothetical protein VK766_02625 [Cytophagaceae bacterium]|jgi:hypothetical protein|nr:hypothetical protein [Cytophagaceae bacterium]